MPLLKGHYHEQSRMDEEVYILYVILKSLISVSMCVSVLNEEDHRSIQTQLLEIRHESLTFKIQVQSVSSTGRALHWYCTGQEFESYSSLNFSGFLFATGMRFLH